MQSWLFDQMIRVWHRSRCDLPPSLVKLLIQRTPYYFYLSFIWFNLQYFGNQLYNVYLLIEEEKWIIKSLFLYNLKLEQMLIIVYYVISFRECMVYKTNNMKQRENKWVFNKNQPTSSRENCFSYSVCLHIESALCFKSLILKDRYNYDKKTFFQL